MQHSHPQAGVAVQGEPRRGATDVPMWQERRFTRTGGVPREESLQVSQRKRVDSMKCWVSRPYG